MLEKIIARFKEGTPVVLTRDEELEVLEWVKEHGQRLGAGSSRATYTFMDKYVVKIALSDEGALQHKIEREFYADFWYKGILATLFAYGKTINIAERLTKIDCLADENEELFIELVEELNYATEYDGGDNEQIGYSTLYNRWVAYDYGYNDNYWPADLVGNMNYWVFVLDIVGLAIKSVKNDMSFYSYETLYKMNIEDSEDCENYEEGWYD